MRKLEGGEILHRLPQQREKGENEAAVALVVLLCCSLEVAYSYPAGRFALANPFAVYNAYHDFVVLLCQFFCSLLLWSYCSGGTQQTVPSMNHCCNVLGGDAGICAAYAAEKSKKKDQRTLCTDYNYRHLLVVL